MKSALARVWRAVRTFVELVFVRPVREGRLRTSGWPAGLLPLVVLSGVGAVVATLLVLFATPLRAALPLTMEGNAGAADLPAPLMWIILALTAGSLTLAQLGALHARAWLRWLTTALTALVLLLSASFDTEAVPVAKFGVVVTIALVVLVVALRGHRVFRWWDALLVGIPIWGSFALSIAVTSTLLGAVGTDAAPQLAAFLLSQLGVLAVPSVLAASAAVGELAVSAANWAVTALHRNLGRVVMVIALVLVGAWRVWELVQSAIDLPATPTAFASLALCAAFLAAIAGLWWLLRRTKRERSQPTVPDVLRDIRRAALPISIALSVFAATPLLGLGYAAWAYGVPLSIVQPANTAFLWLSGPFAVSVVRAIGGALLIALAFLLARRERAAMPELLSAIGVATLGSGVFSLLGSAVSWTSDGLAAVSTVVILVLLAWYLVRRQLTQHRIAMLTSALLVSAIFAHLDIAAEPLTLLLGFGSTAVVLVGIVWQQLTGFPEANGTSTHYPRATRVLLVVANGMFSLTVLAFVALSRDPDATINLDLYGDVGLGTFGNALVASALLLALWTAHRNREPHLP